MSYAINELTPWPGSSTSRENMTGNLNSLEDVMSEEDFESLDERSRIKKIDTTRKSNRMAFKVHSLIRKRRQSILPHMHVARTELHYNSPHTIGRLQKMQSLTSHYSCVNSISWSSDGALLASGGDDKMLVLTKYPELTTVTTINTGHVANIFCVGFVPHRNNWCITCSGDHQIRLFDVEREVLLMLFEGHQNRVKKFVIPPSSSATSLYSCSDDGTVKLWDLLSRPPHHRQMCSTRIHTACDAFLDDPSVPYRQRSLVWGRSQWSSQQVQAGVSSVAEFPLVTEDRSALASNTVIMFRNSALGHPQAVTSIAIAEQRPEYLVLGGHLPAVWLMDRRMMSCGIADPRPVAQFRPGGRPSCVRTTGVNISYDASRILGSWSGELIYQFSVKKPTEDVNCFLSNDFLNVKSLKNTKPRACCFATKVRRKVVSQYKHSDYPDVLLNEKRKNFSSYSKSKCLASMKTYASSSAEENDNNFHSNSKLGRNQLTYHDKSFITMFKGHCNIHTVKDVQYLGPFSNWVSSGSDDGRFFIWDAFTGRLRSIGHAADSTIVNCITEHPLYDVIATSGIDRSIKIWCSGGLIYTLDRRCEAVRSIIRNNETRRQSSPRPLIGLRRVFVHD